MTIYEELDELLPEWREHYEGDPLMAAFDLGILDPPINTFGDGEPEWYPTSPEWRQACAEVDAETLEMMMAAQGGCE